MRAPFSARTGGDGTTGGGGPDKAMQTHYTPGPWEVADITKNGDLTLILGKRGDAHITHWPSPIPIEERRANAQLIAAAPDLVEALKLAAVELEILAEMHPRMCSKRKEATEKARAALQKAGGTL